MQRQTLPVLSLIGFAGRVANATTKAHNNPDFSSDSTAKLCINAVYKLYHEQIELLNSHADDSKLVASKMVQHYKNFAGGEMSEWLGDYSYITTEMRHFWFDELPTQIRQQIDNAGEFGYALITVMDELFFDMGYFQGMQNKPA
ncbi:hypothetical protein ACFBZI_11785 [Moraxella sp. ZJ142]